VREVLYQTTRECLTGLFALGLFFQVRSTLWIRAGQYQLTSTVIFCLLTATAVVCDRITSKVTAVILLKFPTSESMIKVVAVLRSFAFVIVFLA
jgi:hypothetical protein